ncbi:OmpH family outer membrane protein [Treponema brennaborense]|uniref:Outer membrane chaperone Skp (OmpH) n=1 Tax=Treponema brennaborense (strain DSM 12168 / CIP 105900 / DD5/3) TaxID=906968 RepID=F4LPL0_TREBD|nr:OmpH family outer membrane protein [Treponema brennaborense]AEE17006.1 outer membrane chaperone Skp (OmpH) [Treponema brennaborense DSM 12168]
MKNKYVVCALVCCAVFCAAGGAQQITKFGVVDTARVYESYFRETGPVRNYEAKRAEFQAEINKQTEALRDLQSKKAEYRKNGNESAALKLEAEITTKTDILNEYTNAKNIELESLKRSLKTSDDFYRRLYATLERIAEAGGYSMILSLQESNAILWYSPTVDVTDEVISALGL